MKPKAGRSTFVALLFLAGAAAVALPLGAGDPIRSRSKPVIGKASSTPAQATAGAPLTVRAKVTRSDNGAPLTHGLFALPADGRGEGRVTRHVRRRRRPMLVQVPLAATSLQVTMTVKAGTATAMRSFAFAVHPAPKPTLSVGDVTVNEGNSGTTAMSFPVTLSKASTQSVSASYATANGTATSPADYARRTTRCPSRPVRQARRSRSRSLPTRRSSPTRR